MSDLRDYRLRETVNGGWTVTDFGKGYSGAIRAYTNTANMLMDLKELLAESDKVYTGGLGKYRIVKSVDTGPFDASKFGVDPRDPPKTTMPAADGWIEWKGGENPAPGKMVDYILRNGYKSNNEAVLLHWGWTMPTADHPVHQCEIVRYRIAGDAP